MPTIDENISEFEALVKSHEAAIEQKYEEIKAFTELKMQEISMYTQEIAVLRRRMNTQLPIARLPDELLVEIFHQHRMAYFFHHFRPGKSRPIRDGPDSHPNWWLPFTAVCHSWRELALASPLLWSHLDNTIFAYPQLMKSTISSFPQLTLHIYANDGNLSSSRTRAYKNTLKVSSMESDRIRHLDLGSPWWAFRSSINESITLSAGHFSELEHLEIHILTGVGMTANDVVFPALVRSACRAPRLRSLVLERCPIIWIRSLQPSSTLTHLTLSHPIPFSASEDRRIDLYTILTNAEKLESLVLDHIHVQSSQRVKLPSTLKELSIVDNIVAIQCAIDSFVSAPPPRILLEIEGYASHSTSSAPNIFAFATKYALNFLGSDGYLSGEFDYSPTRGKHFSIKVYPHGECPTSSATDHACQLELVFRAHSIDGRVPYSVWLKIVNDPNTPSFFSYFKNLSIKASDVGGRAQMAECHIPSQTILSTILSMTPDIDTLQILFQPEDNISFKALKPRPDGTIPVPRLTSLHVLQWITQSYLNLDRETQTNQLSDWAEAIYQCLEARQSALTANGTDYSLKNLCLWPPSPQGDNLKNPLTPSDPSVVDRLKTLVEAVKIGWYSRHLANDP